MSTTLPLPKPLRKKYNSHDIGESGSRQDSLPKVKVPFLLTSMNNPRKPLLIWVWTRRGKRWVVDQELRFDDDSKRNLNRA